MIKVKLKTVNEQLDESLDEQGIMSKIASLNPFRQNKQINANLNALNARIKQSQELLKAISYDASKAEAQQIIARAKSVQDKLKVQKQLKDYNEKLDTTYKQINGEIIKLQNLFDTEKLNQETAREIITKVTELVSSLEASANSLADEEKKKKMLAGLKAIKNYPLIIQNLSANAGTFNKINDVSRFKGKLDINIRINEYYYLDRNVNLKPFLDYCFSKFITDKKLLTATALSKELASLKTLSEARRTRASKYKQDISQEPEQASQPYDAIKKNLIISIKSLKVPSTLKTVVDNSIIPNAGEDKDDLLLKYALFFSTYKEYLEENRVQYSDELAAIGSLSQQLLKAFGTK